MKRRSAGLLAAALALAVTGCSDSGSGGGGNADSPTDPSTVSGEITVLTHRTDLVNDGTMKKYADEFSKTYTKVKVKFEGMTSYESEVKIRMNSENYGDVLFIPGALKRSDYPRFFSSLGSVTDMAKKYRYTSFNDFKGKSYGLAPNGNSVGFVYNKKVWADAGITQWPVTTDEFLADLQAIKSKGSAVPYYTNYKDSWPLTSWQMALGTATCDPAANDKLATNTAPWSQGTDLNIIDSLIYNIVNKKLIEPDPTTTNWENSKNLIATGKIGTMYLGSWAILQMQDAAKKAGTDPANIGFMPFPARAGGKFCSVNAPDYQQAINIHSKNKPAARAWLDWFADTSTYAKDAGAISSLKNSVLPDTLKEYQEKGVNLIELSQAKAALVNEIDNESEVGLNKPDYRQKIVDVARGSASGSLDSLFGDLNKRWAAGIKSAGS